MGKNLVWVGYWVGDAGKEPKGDVGHVMLVMVTACIVVAAVQNVWWRGIVGSDSSRSASCSNCYQHATSVHLIEDAEKSRLHVGFHAMWYPGNAC